MAENERMKETEEEFVMEDDIEEKKGFPVWIIPIIAGPILLIVLIVALAEPTGPIDTPEIFNQTLLESEADEFYSQANKLNIEARGYEDQSTRDKLFDKASALCDKAIDRYEKIRVHYEEKGYEPEKGMWLWEKKYMDTCQLRGDINRDRGMTPRDDGE